MKRCFLGCDQEDQEGYCMGYRTTAPKGCWRKDMIDRRFFEDTCHVTVNCGDCNLECQEADP